MNEIMIDICKLSKNFGSSRTPVQAVSNVIFSIGKGETVGLVAESGSGKTTIGRMLSRLTNPTVGQMLYHGDAGVVDLATLSQRQYLSLRAKIQVVFQDPYASLNPRMRVRQILGEALDVSIQAQVINLLGEIKDRLGLTMLLISHDLEVVEYLCDRVVVLYLGRVLEIAPTQKLYTQALHPYTQALLAASPIPDLAVVRKEQPLEGELPSPADPPSGCMFCTCCPLAVDHCAKVDMGLREHSPGHWQACWRNF